MRRRAFLCGLAAMSSRGATVGDRFGATIDQLRKTYLVAGMSAAIVRSKELVWAKGFGERDREGGLEADTDTPYRIASVTKPLVATILLQLVERGQVNLDDPVAGYIPASDAALGELRARRGVSIRHVLTHTSEGRPGTYFNYNADRFAAIGYVIERHLGIPLRRAIVERLLDPLEMSRSVPGQDSTEERYQETLRDLAKPYHFDRDRRIVAVDYPRWRGINASAGLISTVEDLARFDIALDRHELVKAATLRSAWAATRMPYGLGWFVQWRRGVQLVWHYGWWAGAYSSLYLKVPSRGVSLILLANGDGLSRDFPLSAADVTASPFARAFLENF